MLVGFTFMFTTISKKKDQTVENRISDVLLETFVFGE